MVCGLAGRRAFAGRVRPPPGALLHRHSAAQCHGVLTMGHVLNNTLQDILIRRARLEGRAALWCRHRPAGIANANRGGARAAQAEAAPPRPRPRPSSWPASGNGGRRRATFISNSSRRLGAFL